VLLNLGEPGGLSSTQERVRMIDAKAIGRWELPVIGDVPAPTAVLIRPDGHVAWVGDNSYAGIDEAVSRWFGSG
jgi:3-(3-hydroxy-phenyl)propionate hydroxylase